MARHRHWVRLYDRLGNVCQPMSERRPAPVRTLAADMNNAEYNDFLQTFKARAQGKRVVGVSIMFNNRFDTLGLYFV
jgi:hypothetical protein